MFRELEDALLRLRFNHLHIGLIMFKSQGAREQVLQHEQWLAEGAQNDWFFKEVVLFQKRTFG